MKALKYMKQKLTKLMPLVGWLELDGVWWVHQKVVGSTSSNQGTLPRFPVQSSIGSCTGDNRWMFLSHVNVSLYILYSYITYGITNRLKSIKKQTNISSGEDYKKEKLNWETGNSIMIVGGFNTPLSIINRTTGQSTNKEKKTRLTLYKVF